MADLSDYGGFADGWAYPDERGIWTEGSLSKLALALDGGARESDYVLALSLGSICVAPDVSLKVEALVDGERIAARDFNYGDPEWYIELPPRGPTTTSSISRSRSTSPAHRSRSAGRLTTAVVSASCSTR